MSETKSTTVEVRLPTRMGYEKVAMSTAAGVPCPLTSATRIAHLPSGDSD